MSKKLRVQIVRHRDLVSVSVLEQPNSIKRGSGPFFEHNGFELESDSCVDLHSAAFSVRGVRRGEDDYTDCLRCDDVEEAKALVARLRACIAAYNASIAEKTPAVTDDDVETIIAE